MWPARMNSEIEFFMRCVFSPGVEGAIHSRCGTHLWHTAHVPHQHFAAAYKVDAAAASVLYSELKQEVVCVKVSPRQMSFLSFTFLPFH